MFGSLGYVSTKDLGLNHIPLREPCRPRVKKPIHYLRDLLDDSQLQQEDNSLKAT